MTRQNPNHAIGVEALRRGIDFEKRLGQALIKEADPRYPWGIVYGRALDHAAKVDIQAVCPQGNHVDIQASTSPKSKGRQNFLRRRGILPISETDLGDTGPHALICDACPVKSACEKRYVR